jgi:hypothetical protein
VVGVRSQPPRGQQSICGGVAVWRCPHPGGSGRRWFAGGRTQGAPAHLCAVVRLHHTPSSKLQGAARTFLPVAWPLGLRPPAPAPPTSSRPAACASAWARRGCTPGVGAAGRWGQPAGPTLPSLPCAGSRVPRPPRHSAARGLARRHRASHLHPESARRARRARGPGRTLVSAMPSCPATASQWPRPAVRGGGCAAGSVP